MAKTLKQALEELSDDDLEKLIKDRKSKASSGGSDGGTVTVREYLVPRGMFEKLFGSSSGGDDDELEDDDDDGGKGKILGGLFG